MRVTIAALVATALAPCAATVAPASSQARTTICGQIKNGPYATYTSLVTKKKLSGNTWTIFATGVPCAKAMQAAPKILKWWAHAKVDASNHNISGFLFTKENDGHGKSGIAGCKYKTGALANISLVMTGPYTIAQLRRLLHIGP
jgi:hypothetical protein